MADIDEIFKRLTNLDDIAGLAYAHEYLSPPLNKRLAEIFLSQLWDSLGHEPLCSHEIDFSNYHDVELVTAESELEFIIRKAKPVEFAANPDSLKLFFVHIHYLVQEERKRRAIQ